MIDNDIRFVKAFNELQKRVAEMSDVDYEGVEGERFIRVKVPKGERGADGKDGRDGKDGINGRDGINGKDGIDGKNGLDGRNGRDGIDGKDGRDGKDGVAGVGIANAEVKDGELYITLTDGKKINCGRVRGDSGYAYAISIKTVEIRDGHLWCILTNNKEIDCGAIGGGSSAVTSVNGQTGDVVLAIPTKTSDLINDSGFLTSHQDISGKQNVATLETDVKAFINRDYILSILDNGDEVAY